MTNMDPTIIVIGVICIGVSFLLEMGSYYKQIAKTLRTKRSSHVSSSAFLYKIAKYLVTLAALAIFSNWVAFGLEVAALVVCSIALYIIAKYKPKNWRLFG